MVSISPCVELYRRSSVAPRDELLVGDTFFLPDQDVHVVISCNKTKTLNFECVTTMLFFDAPLVETPLSVFHGVRSLV